MLTPPRLAAIERVARSTSETRKAIGFTTLVRPCLRPGLIIAYVFTLTVFTHQSVTFVQVGPTAKWP